MRQKNNGQLRKSNYIAYKLKINVLHLKKKSCAAGEFYCGFCDPFLPIRDLCICGITPEKQKIIYKFVFVGK